MDGRQLRSRIYEILEVASPDDSASRAFDVFIISLISLNVAAVVLESVKGFSSRYNVFFTAFEIFSVVVFTIEYVFRVWSCATSREFNRPFFGRLRFAVTPLALIDLMAILPFYLPFSGNLDLRSLRVVRLFRLFRLLKIARYSESFRVLGRALRAKKEELLITVLVVFVLLVMSSSVMYFVENEHQPDKFSSIPAAMWWGVATLTTVGYGDICPVTAAGKFIGAIIAVLGIGMVALPTGILGSAFVEEIQKRQRVSKVCPHCGRETGE